MPGQFTEVGFLRARHDLYGVLGVGLLGLAEFTLGAQGTGRHHVLG